MVAVLAVAALVIAGPIGAQAQQTPRVYRIGFVSPTAPGPGPDALRQGLRDAGYVEGKNLIIEARFAEGHQERLPELIREVLRLKVDVLVTAGGAGVLAAKRETTTVPIVFAGVGGDPVALGIAPSLARPGGNVTGAVVDVGPGIATKWLPLLKEAVPRVSHAAVLWNSKSSSPGAALYVPDMKAAARRSGIKLDWFGTAEAAELDRALAAIATSRAQGLIVTADPFFFANRVKVVQFAASNRLPAVYFFRAFPDAGGLMSYGGSLEESFRTAAAHVAKILNGARPGDLPIEQPTTIELVINLKTAKTLGLTIPRSVLLRADHVID